MNPILRLIAAVCVALPLAATAASAERGHPVNGAASTTSAPAEVIVPPHNPHTCIGWRRFCRNR